MAKYSANPLRLLDKLYNFVGGERNRSELDLASPIVRVHDLSREAELGTYVGTEDGLVSQSFPFFTINVDNVHGGADTQIQQLGVYANQSPTWALATWQAPDPNLETIWILRAWATSSGSSMTECQILLDYLPKAGAGSGQSPFGLIFFADGSMVAATDSPPEFTPCATETLSGSVKIAALTQLAIFTPTLPISAALPPINTKER